MGNNLKAGPRRPGWLPMQHTDEERTAYHEAGHAVLAVVLGVPLKTITIEEDDNASGRNQPADAVKIPDPWEDGSQDFCRRHALITLGGMEAEFILLGDYDPLQIQVEQELRKIPLKHRSFAGPYSGDDKTLVDLLWVLSGADYGHYETISEELRQDCRKLVTAHQRAIRTLAQALIKRRTLNGSEVEDLIRMSRE